MRGEGKGMVGRGRGQRLKRTEDKEQKNRKRPCGLAIAELFVGSVWRRIFQQEPSAPAAQTLSPLFWQACHRRSPQPLSHRGGEYAGRRHRRGNIRSTSMSTIRKC